jgi:2-polyprenyl-6-hydroxyphenyl methylase/3-demethylubiquinone-9 3-methyltransferase
MVNSTFEEQVRQGKRFEFGKNWQNFLSLLNDERIVEAEKSLKTMLKVENLEGKTFLDIGSGSGLFSLAARRLGAKVHSFDYDPYSVNCTKELKNRYYLLDDNWKIEQGSVLDSDYLSLLGQFDVVYSWGVLHHTGNIWQSCENIIPLAKDEGKIFIAIYNNQGFKSDIWLKIKQIYCSGIFGQIIVSIIIIPFYFILGAFLNDCLKLKNPVDRYREYQKNRGMSIYYDWLDWLGGLPFETAKTDDVINFFSNLGWYIDKLNAVGQKLGCNEYMFRKNCIN